MSTTKDTAPLSPPDAATGAAPPTGAQAPSEDRLKVTAPAEVAGGLKAIASTLGYASDQMGLGRAAKALLTVNQHEGFDCPGCAWPDPARPAPVEFCENGARAVADEATRGRVDEAFFAAHPISELLTWTDRRLNQAGRLTHPMLKEPGSDHYRPVSWEAAFDLIGGALQDLESPDEAIFYTSGRTSNEAAFLYQLFVRHFGTNNLPDCSNMCHESSGRGLGEVIGVGKGTVTLEDFEKADLILVIGQNPGTNHPRMLTTLQEAAQRGCRIISINPLKEAGLKRFSHPQKLYQLLGPGTPLAERFVQVKVGGDVALMQGIIKALLDLEATRPGQVLDRAFIAEHTLGFDALVGALRATPWDLLVQESGITRRELEEIAEIIAGAEAMICCWAMGLTQHKHGVANIQSVVNLLLLGGHMGRPGAGACPVRGHSNVQGDRTMGIWERPSQALLDALAETFDFEPPRAHGLDTVGAIRAMHRGSARIFFAMGGNFLSATPDTELTAEALQRCALTVQVSTKLNRSHLVTGEGALILPCLGRTEIDRQEGRPQFVSVENSMGIVHTSQGHLEPASPHLMSEPAIVSALARATLGPEHPLPWEAWAKDYDLIRDLIAQVIPGHEDYNERVRQPGGFLLPNGARERRFDTPSGKAHFTVHPVPRLGLPPDRLMMMTLRAHDQYNTTIYGLDDRYRGIHGGRRVVMLAPETLTQWGLEAGDQVDLISHFEGQERIAKDFTVVPYDLPRQCAATYFPEANVLVPIDSIADKSRTPTSKSVIISLRPRS